MNIYNLKLELQKLPLQNIKELKEWCNITTVINNDCLWLIALNLQQRYNSAQQLSGKIEKISTKSEKKKMTTKRKAPADIIYDMSIVDCDTIDWFVDILGTLDFLEKVILIKSGQKVPVIDVGATAISHFMDKPGLYFRKGHWYCIKEKQQLDSYKLDYQVKGTAHFCQTFALLIYLGLTDSLISIKEGRFINSAKAAQNIKTAITFWENVFIQYPELLQMFLRELHTSEYDNRPVIFAGRSVDLGKFTKKDLFQYMSIIKENAINFFNCQQG